MSSDKTDTACAIAARLREWVAYWRDADGKIECPAGEPPVALVERAADALVNLETGRRGLMQELGEAKAENNRRFASAERPTIDAALREIAAMLGEAEATMASENLAGNVVKEAAARGEHVGLRKARATLTVPLVESASAPATPHKNHPRRHFDHTCKACMDEAEMMAQQHRNSTDVADSRVSPPGD